MAHEKYEMSDYQRELYRTMRALKASMGGENLFPRSLDAFKRVVKRDFRSAP